MSENRIPPITGVRGGLEKSRAEGLARIERPGHRTLTVDLDDNRDDNQDSNREQR